MLEEVLWEKTPWKPTLLSWVNSLLTINALPQPTILLSLDEMRLVQQEILWPINSWQICHIIKSPDVEIILCIISRLASVLLLKIFLLVLEKVNMYPVVLRGNPNATVKPAALGSTWAEKPLMLAEEPPLLSDLRSASTTWSVTNQYKLLCWLRSAGRKAQPLKRKSVERQEEKWAQLCQIWTPLSLDSQPLCQHNAVPGSG